MELLARQLGPYRTDARLGVGGMGEVFRAHDEDGAVVAVKVLHPHLLSVSGAFARFQREAELGRTIAHPNVVRTLGVETATVDGQELHFLVMEYVEGQTLQLLLEELDHLPEELCRHIGLQVARALAAIHERSAVHRDLTPANVIITPDHEVKVMDFGVAHLVDEAHRLTAVGDFLGSILYAAPEQWDPKAPVDARADLFTLGILLYELATGRHPFAGLQGTAPVSALARGKVEPASATKPELSPFFVELVDALLQPDPEKRFPKADLLCRVLESGERSPWWQQRSRELERSGRRRARRLPVPRDARVCGREPELERLRAALAKARERRGQVVLIEGESGIGKTRLVDEFARLEAGTIDLLFGVYAPGEAATAEGALSSAFREHLGVAALEERLAELLPEIPGLVQPFAGLLRGTGDATGPSTMTSDMVMTGFIETTRALARETPIALFVDNLDFAPREARAIFAALARAIEDEPILLIGAFRPGPTGETLARVQTLEYASRIVLQRLGAQDLAALLTDALGSLSLSQQLGWEIARKSDGNPFYVFEILRDLRERKRLIRDESGGWRTTGLIREIETPESVRSLLHARLRHVSQEDRDLLDVAACCGPRFDPAIVAAAAEEELVPTLKRFRRLERDHGLIRPDGRAYVFDHHQLQEAIHDELFTQLREQYHLAVGQASEAQWGEPSGAQSVALCRHFLRGGAPSQARAHLLPAMRELNAGHLIEEVYDLGKKALEAGIPQGPRERFQVLKLLASAANLEGDSKTEAAAGAEMMEIASAEGDESIQLDALLALGMQKYVIAECHEGIRIFEEARELASHLGDGHREEEAERGIGVCWSRLGNREKALPHHRRSLELCEALGLDGSAAGAHVNVAIQLESGGDLEAAESHYVRAIELARATGHVRWEANATANYGRVFFQRGDYTQAWKHAMRYRELARQTGDRRGEATSGMILIALWTLFGAIDEIEHEIARVANEVEETGDRWLSAFVLSKRAWLAEQKGDLSEAQRLMEKGISLRREIDDRDGLALLLTEAGALSMEQGKRKDALAFLEEALALAEIGPETRASALCELAVLQPEQVAAAAAALENAPTDRQKNIRGLYCLWKATATRSYLERANQELEAQITRLPAEYQEQARTQPRLHREVCEAWTRELG